MILSMLKRIALLFMLTVLFAPAMAGGQDVKKSLARGPLDGMAFEGRIGPVGNLDRDDVLYFNNGLFWSSTCTKCGFAPGAYWVRDANAGIEFQGILESQERGKFSYLGVVRDGRITVSINWSQKRWYWSIDRDLYFEGTLSEASEISMSLRAARETAGEEPLYPGDCPS